MTTGEPSDREADRAFYAHQQRRRRQLQYRLTGRVVAGDVPRTSVALGQVARRGDVDDAAPLTLRLRVEAGREAGHTIELHPGNLTIGRAPDSAIHLNENTVSHNHAVLVVTTNNVTIEDHGSTNGTMLNGTKIRDPETLRAGDLLQFGTVVLTVEDASIENQG